MKTDLWMSSAAVVIGALRVKLFKKFKIIINNRQLVQLISTLGRELANTDVYQWQNKKRRFQIILITPLSI